MLRDLAIVTVLALALVPAQAISAVRVAGPGPASAPARLQIGPAARNDRSFSATFLGAYTLGNCDGKGDGYLAFAGAGKVHGFQNAAETGALFEQSLNGRKCTLSGAVLVAETQSPYDGISALVTGVGGSSPCKNLSAQYFITGGTGKFKNASGAGYITFTCTKSIIATAWSGTIRY
jgi:hypothetical protein